uniref:Uncharacterized protein n=1 Tax=Solanum lycopersicum TaxID=4081 RepID=A0A3Q7EA31_SOLLC
MRGINWIKIDYLQIFGKHMSRYMGMKELGGPVHHFETTAFQLFASKTFSPYHRILSVQLCVTIKIATPFRQCLTDLLQIIMYNNHTLKNLPSQVGLSHAFTKEFSIFYHQRKGHKIIELSALRMYLSYKTLPDYLHFGDYFKSKGLL